MRSNVTEVLGTESVTPRCAWRRSPSGDVPDGSTRSAIWVSDTIARISAVASVDRQLVHGGRLRVARVTRSPGSGSGWERFDHRVVGSVRPDGDGVRTGDGGDADR